MTYRETIDYLYRQLPVYHRIGKEAYKADLNNSHALDEYFGFPHRRFRSIHVAGTNGKGSVSHMLASILQEAGYKTALYTSPHLIDYRERIKINGEKISEEEVVAFVEKNNSILKSIVPSFFEMSVAMAFDFFARSGVEVAVVEVGLGGRLDSTNIITPILSVITNIGHDHMNLLGETIDKIAFEKAGIIKKNVPVTIGERRDLATEIFISKAADMSSDISFAEDAYRCSLEKLNLETGHRKFTLTSKKIPQRKHGETLLGGDYQARNIQTVAGAVDFLREPFDISSVHLMDGIRKTVINTGLYGRWQILSKAPLIVCDTGHNLEGLKCVVKQINNAVKEKLHLVLGFVNDKDLSEILPLFPKDAQYYFTKASVPRALDEKVLKETASGFGLKGHSFDSVEGAVQNARAAAGKNDMIFIGGSTFVVANALCLF